MKPYATSITLCTQHELPFWRALKRFCSKSKTFRDTCLNFSVSNVNGQLNVTHFRREHCCEWRKSCGANWWTRWADRWWTETDKLRETGAFVGPHNNYFQPSCLLHEMPSSLCRRADLRSSFLCVVHRLHASAQKFFQGPPHNSCHALCNQREINWKLKWSRDFEEWRQTDGQQLEFAICLCLRELEKLRLFPMLGFSTLWSLFDPIQWKFDGWTFCQCSFTNFPRWNNLT